MEQVPTASSAWASRHQAQSRANLWRCAHVTTCLQAGDTLYTASMKPIMTFLEDSGPGAHDTTAAACSYGLYVLQIGEVRLCAVHCSCPSGVIGLLPCIMSVQITKLQLCWPIGICELLLHAS
jgi:hypothetical protein